MNRGSTLRHPVVVSPPLLVLEPGRSRRRPAHRGRLRRALSTLLILAGCALGADVVTTLVWQEPVTAIIAALERAHVDERYVREVRLGRAGAAQLAAIDGMDARIAYLARREAASVPFGAALGTLSIPTINARYQLIQGADSASLELGPGHYAGTDLPGEGGTTAIAGHRTTYLAPFRDINELRAGERIQLFMPYGHFTYLVQRVEVVAPGSWWITQNAGYDRLVLSSCNPLFSAAQRIVVFARLAGETPRGQAIATRD